MVSDGDVTFVYGSAIVATDKGSVDNSIIWRMRLECWLTEQYTVLARSSQTVH